MAVSLCRNLNLSSSSFFFPKMSFSIQGKGLKFNTAADVESYCTEIESKQHKEISLGGNTWGVDAAKRLSQALKNQQELTTLYFSDMFTGRLKDEIPLCLEAMIDALVDKQHLVHVDLSDNAFGPHGAKPLMRLIIENRNIRYLRLNNNGLGIEGMRLISQALIEAHEKQAKLGLKDNLQVIIAGRNRMESPGVGHLANALKHYKDSLLHVQIPQNSIRPDGVQVLMEALKEVPLLQHLDLQDNTFTEPGSLALAQALPSWPDLKVLHVGDCLLGQKGAIHVIKALTGAQDKLEQLYLAFNEIYPDGAQLIPQMLKNKKQLTKIELNGNCFKPEGELVENIQQQLEQLGCPDALDELDEMELDSDEEEEDEQEQDEDDEVDRLADKVSQAL
ncbi:hypothetical protein EDD86DRAFT_221556 [Gorgonomyces haynaldii]|nr:hypothetical protein EDD86DRAFT_221556 [Gorgonomyces haynaldii]